MSSRILALAVFLGFASACASPGPDSSTTPTPTATPTPPDSGFGGAVTIDVDASDGGMGSAVFYSYYSGPNLDDIPIGTCYGDESPAIAATTADVGTALGATAGATTIDLARSSGADGTSYDSPDWVAGAPADADYAISIDGTPLGTLHVPRFVGTPAVSGHTLSWTPDGGDEAVVAFLGSSSLYFCATADDGSFTIPADVLGAAPSGYATLNVGTMRHVTFDGRDVVLIGRTSAPSVTY